MAQLQATTIHASGSVRLGRTPDTSHVGLMWYDSGSAKLHFTKCILVPGTPGTPGNYSENVENKRVTLENSYLIRIRVYLAKTYLKSKLKT